MCVTDGVGTVALCKVRASDGGHVAAEVIERRHYARPSPEVVVYQGAAKGAKVDDVIERLAQLGVACVRVFLSERSVVRWDARKSQALADRWSAIARSAAKQSRNPFMVATGRPLPWTALTAELARSDDALVLWEEAALPLRRALRDTARVDLVVGPEGGLTSREVEELEDAGARLVSLGARILRTENAPVVATAVILYHHGLIG